MPKKVKPTATKTVAKQSLIQRGLDPISAHKKATARAKERGQTSWFSINDGESRVIRILTPVNEIASASVHRIWMPRKVGGRNLVAFPCFGEDCPGCDHNNKARFRGYLVVYDFKQAADNKKLSGEEAKKAPSPAKILSGGIMLIEDIIALMTKFSDPKQTFEITREGSGIDTTYRVVPDDKMKPAKEEIAAMKTLPDLEAALDPGDISEIARTLKIGMGSPGSIDTEEDEDVEEEDEE